MARHTELVHLPGSEGYRFCLDSVVTDDGRTEYAFVWRGTRVNPDGFQPRPAYFDWEGLAQTIRLGFSENAIPHEDKDRFLRALFGL